jgi:hypothetical protein
MVFYLDFQWLNKIQYNRYFDKKPFGHIKQKAQNQDYDFALFVL